MELVQDSCRGLCAWLEVSFPTGAPQQGLDQRRLGTRLFHLFSKPCDWVLPNPHAVVQVIRPKWSCSSWLTNCHQVHRAPLWELSSPSSGLCLQACTAQVWPSAKLLGRYTNMCLGVKTCTLGLASTGHPFAAGAAWQKATVWQAATAASEKLHRSIPERFLQMKRRSRKK